MAAKTIDSRKLFEVASNLLQAGRPSISFLVWQAAENRIISVGSQLNARDRRPMAQVVKAYVAVTNRMDETGVSDDVYGQLEEKRAYMVVELRKAVKTYRMSDPDLRDREADVSFDRLVDEVMDIEEEESELMGVRRQ